MVLVVSLNCVNFQVMAYSEMNECLLTDRFVVPCGRCLAGESVSCCMLLDEGQADNLIQWNPSIKATIGNEIFAFIEGWP